VKNIDIITLPSSPTFVIVDTTVLPSSLPSSVYVPAVSPVPSTVSVTVSIPAHWTSPVAVPANLIPTSVPQISISSGLVIVQSSKVPSSIPTYVIASITTTTYVPPECQTVVSYFAAPTRPTNL